MYAGQTSRKPSAPSRIFFVFPFFSSLTRSLLHKFTAFTISRLLTEVRCELSVGQCLIMYAVAKHETNGGANGHPYFHEQRCYRANAFSL